MPYYNHKWAADVLGMRLNEEKGPDIIDDGKFLELKFLLINPKKHKEIKNSSYPKVWTVMDHQMNYEKDTGLKGYWGLGIYELNIPIKSIRDKYNLEKFVLSRELYIVEWGWMNQFEKNHTNGKTEFSEWDYYLRYPKFKNLPDIVSIKKVNKGKLYFTNESQLESFDINKKI